MTHKFYNPIMSAVIISCLLFLSSSSALFAEARFKLGVIDMGRVSEEFKKAKDANKILGGERKRLQKKVVAMEDELFKLYERKDKAKNISEELMAKMDGEIGIKLKEREEFLKNSQKNLSDREKELFEPILKEIDGLIQQIGKEEKYDLIVRRPPVLYQAILYGAPIIVLYADPKYDITDKVLKTLNDKYDKEESEKKTKAEDEKKKANKEDNSKPKPVAK